MTSDARPRDLPALVRARMVNEFSYCPRLFFLEWVQARFTDNLDTVEGGYEHPCVDQPAGRAPLPEHGELVHARAVQVSSTRLGLVATIDVIEGDEGVVRPVDTKRGALVGPRASAVVRPVAVAARRWVHLRRRFHLLHGLVRARARAVRRTPRRAPPRADAVRDACRAGERSRASDLQQCPLRTP